MKNETKISAGAKLAKELLYVPKHVADSAPEALDAAFAFCEDYKNSLTLSKPSARPSSKLFASQKSRAIRSFLRTKPTLQAIKSISITAKKPLCAPPSARNLSSKARAL